MFLFATVSYSINCGTICSHLGLSCGFVASLILLFHQFYNTLSHLFYSIHLMLYDLLLYRLVFLLCSVIMSFMSFWKVLKHLTSVASWAVPYLYSILELPRQILWKVVEIEEIKDFYIYIIYLLVWESIRHIYTWQYDTLSFQTIFFSTISCLCAAVQCWTPINHLACDCTQNAVFLWLSRRAWDASSKNLLGDLSLTKPGLGFGWNCSSTSLQGRESNLPPSQGVSTKFNKLSSWVEHKAPGPYSSCAVDCDVEPQCRNDTRMLGREP